MKPEMGEPFTLPKDNLAKLCESLFLSRCRLSPVSLAYEGATPASIINANNDDAG